MDLNFKGAAQCLFDSMLNDAYTDEVAHEVEAHVLPLDVCQVEFVAYHRKGCGVS
ncbi:hypothetical protein ALQ30_200383 [Pseudomonas syringae pv. persicae]|uniref:Uncharacterized protein n=1 Tax=Pseudomonas syringae pv. persicae TaxID=237306 RepID=A0A3M4ASP5_9PSED|nr:hypothetical protein ALQ30_200383 [Pseudomonas syringae pv. persicae]